MTVVLADLADLREVVADLLDAGAPLVVDRKRARELLDLSDTTFGRLVRDGVIRPVPHLRPPKYSIELLRRFAAGDEHAFSAIPAGATASADPAPADAIGPSGSSADAPSGGSVSPLRPQGAGGPSSTAADGSDPSTAA